VCFAPDELRDASGLGRLVVVKEKTPRTVIPLAAFMFVKSNLR
jgi:hypothetical protein